MIGKHVHGLDAREHAGPGIVKQPGRLLADGTRRGARVARRVTLYLPIDVAKALEDFAHDRRVSLSDIAAELLGDVLGVDHKGAAE